MAKPPKSSQRDRLIRTFQNRSTRARPRTAPRQVAVEQGTRPDRMISTDPLYRSPQSVEFQKSLSRIGASPAGGRQRSGTLTRSGRIPGEPKGPTNPTPGAVTRRRRKRTWS